MRETVAVLRYAFLSGLQDYTTIYTWKTWLAGWLVRVVAQVSFFALFGELIGSSERTEFLVVGNAVLLAALGVMFAVASTSWERWQGTFPLLVASPTAPVLVFLGRSTFWIPDAVASSVGTFFICAAIFDLPLPWPRVLLIMPLIVLIALSTYCLGIFLGGLVLRNPNLRNLVANLVWLTMAAIAGVNVPLSYDPEPLRWLAEVLPLTHGLQAVRGLLDGDPGHEIAVQAGAEAAVGVAFLVLAFLTFDRLAEHGRRDGTIEFGA
ncbi:MAG: ABC transporter permease [Actinobacteria bacterium]|nr:ABC transporter permease [Actinomycetota bacterium]MDQ3380452.1 ABC transporter permease [Actinomycetota bacterium]